MTKEDEEIIHSFLERSVAEGCTTVHFKITKIIVSSWLEFLRQANEPT